jgi:XTP/dITP diphosphohydrolase
LDAGIEPPAETGTTFAENALIKAQALAIATGLPAVADDSGLAVEVMGGSPGIFSARWSGAGRSDTANLNLLLEQLGEISDPNNRRAAFVCAATIVTPDGHHDTKIGKMPGYLTLEPRGQGGFGYDPIFIADEQPPGAERTNAELTSSEKNAISHRGKALRALAPAISEAL